LRRACVVKKEGSVLFENGSNIRQRHGSLTPPRIDIGECLAAVVAHDKTAVVEFFEGPGAAESSGWTLD
jgi:hypothetical protein